MCDGIIAGVGGVLSFLPQIALLFFFLSFLEDSGYMSRAAFIMDRLLRRFGLSGKAFIPMLMGFGCTVPAVMGARTMENEKDRRMTIMLVPFMSCSARLPVYGLLTAAFFPQYGAGGIFPLSAGTALRHRLGHPPQEAGFPGRARRLRAGAAPLPPAHPQKYRPPRVGEGKGFLVKAGTLILAMSVLLWFLQSFGFEGGTFGMVSNEESSILGFVGASWLPVRPLGFGTWQAAVALLTGLVAKEMVVSSMSMFYGFSVTASGAAIAAALGGTFQSPLAAIPSWCSSCSMCPAWRRCPPSARR